MKNEFMKRAIELSVENVDNGGGPFGSVIVKDGRIRKELEVWNSDTMDKIDIIR